MLPPRRWGRQHCWQPHFVPAARRTTPSTEPVQPQGSWRRCPPGGNPVSEKPLLPLRAERLGLPQRQARAQMPSTRVRPGRARHLQMPYRDVGESLGSRPWNQQSPPPGPRRATRRHRVRWPTLPPCRHSGRTLWAAAKDTDPWRVGRCRAVLSSSQIPSSVQQFLKSPRKYALRRLSMSSISPIEQMWKRALIGS